MSYLGRNFDNGKVFYQRKRKLKVGKNENKS